MHKKKGMVLTGRYLLALGIGLVVILVSARLLFGEQFDQTKDTMQGWWEHTLFGPEEFVPYEEDLGSEENIAANSIAALQMAINSVAKGESVDIYGGAKIPQEQVPFDYYIISFSGHIELEEGTTDYREWNFERRFDINQEATEIVTQEEQYIAADYKYGSCPDSNEGQWVNCGNSGAAECYCNGEDDYPAGQMSDISIDAGVLGEAKKASLAPVSDITPVYNIELTVHYKDGTTCKVGTQDSGKKITDTDAQDLLVWGARTVESCPGNPNFEEGDGCDRNGNGIQGAYGPRFYGMNWQDVIGQTNQQEKSDSKKRLVSMTERAAYFPGEVIQNTQANGEGCLDSPTWLECNGIRIYYCGKLGYKSGRGAEESNYYFHIDGLDGQVHSNAGIKILRSINPNTFQEKSSQSRGSRITVRDADARSLGSWSEGAWQYGKEYDLDVFLVGGPIAGIIGAGTAFAMKDLDDPSVYCYNGQKVNNGPVTVKCDERTQSCGVCDFELPQNISKEHDTALAWFAGYGDPKYVVYYEAFPDGEDQAWIIDPLDVSLTSIVLWNAGVHLIPVGGYVLGRIGKFADMVLRKTPRLMRWPYKLISGAVRMPANLIKGAAKKTGDYLKSGIEFATKKVSPMLYVRMFSQADYMLKYVSKSELEVIGSSAEEIADVVAKASGHDLVSLGFKQGKEGRDAALDLIGAKQFIPKMMNEKGLTKEMAESLEYLTTVRTVLIDDGVSAASSRFMRALPVSIAKKGTEYGLIYAAALSIAYEDSRNQKFMPIGVNSIGMKEPYKGAFIKELDSEANEYIIMLRKDRFRGGTLTNIALDQRDSRFYLASPCKANLAIVKANKACWKISGELEDENGNEIEITADIPEGAARERYGNVHFLSHTVDEDYPKTDPRRYEDAVKECVDKSTGFTGLWASIWESPRYNTKAIIVNPIPHGNNWDEGVNFCYGGSHNLAEAAKWSVYLGTIATGIITETLATALEVGESPLILVGVGIPLIALTEGLQFAVDTGIDIGAAYAVNEITEGTKWPNH